MDLARSIPRVLEVPPESEAELPLSASGTEFTVSSPLRSASPQTTAVNLQPEIEPTPSTSGSNWTTIQVTVDVPGVMLELYDKTAKNIAGFALTNGRLRYKSLVDGAAEAELVLKSFTMSNPQAGAEKFKKMIPAAEHSRNQFMVLYTTSGGIQGSSLAIVTVDSLQIIFSVDPIFALLEFFASSIPPVDADNTSASNDAAVETTATSANRGSFDFRFDLHNVIIRVLEDDRKDDTQAMQLSIKKLLVSQQVSCVGFAL